MKRPTSLADLLSGSMREDEAPMTLLQKQAMAEQLKEYAASFANGHNFKANDLIQWKPGMASRLQPQPGGVCIVTEILQNPIERTSEDDPGEPCEILDMRVGVIGSDGTFLIYLADSRRYEPAKLEEEVPQEAHPTH